MYQAVSLSELIVSVLQDDTNNNVLRQKIVIKNVWL